MLDLVILPPWGWLFAGVWGALWGSFFNVAIHRVGLYESVVRPPSRCPSCGKDIAFYDNIPMVSWLLLGGRCRRCRAPISVRYPLVELLSTLLALAVYWRFLDGDPLMLAARFFVYFAFIGTLLVLSAIDLEHMLLPNRIVYPAIPVFFVCGIILHDVSPLDQLIGAVLGYGIVMLTAELFYAIRKYEGMGWGDRTLLMLVGALLGWRGVLWTFFLAPFPAILVTVPAHVLQRKRIFKTFFPFGPFLAMAAAGYVFFGQLIQALLP